MKPLLELTSIEKAKLLHELLPDEIPAFISCMETTANLILKNIDRIHQLWQSKTITAYEWIGLAETARLN